MIGAAISIISSVARSGMPTSDISSMLFVRGLGGSCITCSMGNAVGFIMFQSSPGGLRYELFKPDFRSLNYFCPQGAFFFNAQGEFLRRVGNRISADVEQLFTHLG